MNDDSSQPSTSFPSLDLQGQRLQHEAHQTQALFWHAPTAALLLSPDGRITDVNARGAALLDAPREALVGRHLSQRVSPAFQSTVTRLLTQLFQTGAAPAAEVQVRSPAGDVVDVQLDAALHVTELGPVGHLALTDLTAFKRAQRALLDVNQAKERQLQDRQARWRQLNEEFERVVLATNREVTDRLVRAEGLLALHRQGSQPEHLTHLETTLERTRALLGSLDRFMRAQTMRTHLTSVNLNLVWRDVLRDAHEQLDGRRVRLTSDALPTVQGDRQALKLILAEYLTNALKFTRPRDEARIRVIVQATEHEDLIGMQDNGVGFSIRYKERAFELFERLHPAGQFEGTGIGLAVVRRLCLRFGARAWCEGKPEQGATFWFAWPKVPPNR